MLKVHLDFETRSEADLLKVGAEAYAEHDSTGVLCAAFKRRGGNRVAVAHWLEGAVIDVPNDIEELRELADRSDAIWYAYNAAFERAIWSHVMVGRHGFPEIPLERWRCTAAHAANFGLPRGLEKVGAALGVPMQKDKEGKRVMLKHSRPKRGGGWHDNVNERLVIHEYCKQDVRAEEAIVDAIPEWSKEEQSVWLLDQKINDRGIPIDLDLAEAAIDLMDQLSRELVRELREITKHAVTTGRQVERFLDWLNANGVNAQNLQADTVEGLLAGELPSQDVRRALEIRRQLSRSSVAKYDAMIKRANADGRVRGALLYYGAHTGRWSGRGVQFQNVPRGGLKAHELDAAIDSVMAGDLDWLRARYGCPARLLAATIRPAVCSHRGRFVVCDFAGIENRGIAYLSRHAKLVDNFRDPDFDPYVDMANAIDFPKGFEHDTRLVGKIAVLGLGYGMGAKKFHETCGKWGVEITEGFAKDVVDAYRAKNAPFKQYWRDLEDAAISAVETPGQKFIVGSVLFECRDRWLYCELPSGRSIAYIDPAVVEKETPFGLRPQLTYMGENQLTRKWERQTTWGGKLCENVVQAFARDLLVDSMERLEAAGYPLVMHVHDEIVAELEGGSLEEVRQIMSTPPSWASGCPIDAEGFEGRRYRK